MLAGAPKRDRELPGEAEQLARAVLALGPGAVILTGGHRDVAADLLVVGLDAEALEIEGERHPGGAAHGSGCTHSAVLAAQLALGRDLPTAARIARARAGAAVADGLRELGGGRGPGGRDRAREAARNLRAGESVCHNPRGDEVAPYEARPWRDRARRG